MSWQHFIALTLFDVSPKERPYFSGGKAWTRDRTRAFQERVRTVAATEMISRGKTLLVDTPVLLKVDVMLPRPKRPMSRDWPATKPDLTNIVRAIEDGLEGEVYDQDSRIVEGHYRKFYSDSATPRAFVRVSAWRRKEEG